jgi:pyruvate kinase
LSQSDTKTVPPHKTKLVCTIGPASGSPEIMRQMIRAGMDIARLNFSHGDFETHGQVIADLRCAAETVGRDIAIMADLPGPKMRVGEIAGGPVELKPDAPFTLTVDSVTGDSTRASVSFHRLPQVVHAGDTLYLNDGFIQLRVSDVTQTEVHCRVVGRGELSSRKGLNLPGIDLGASAFTARDRECLEFALANGVDAVSQSFVDSADDVRAVREAARQLGHDPFILAKIERSRALERMDEIFEAADGIMIARGDLGVEVPIERIAVIQKQLMRQAVRLCKPVITATQMLESMTHARQPTRAESTDVANAILDGTDCVMLSAESAVGKYPVEAVATLARIAAATEPHRTRENLWESLKTLPRDHDYSLRDLISLSIEATTELARAAAIVVPTRGGDTVRSIARFRLPVWQSAISGNIATCRQLNFSYGVLPEFNPNLDEDWDGFARRWVERHELAGNLAILVQGPSPKNPEGNMRIEMLDLKRRP